MLETYLFFDGNCREAFEFYRGVFGGEYTTCQPYSAGPLRPGQVQGGENRIMHVALPVGRSSLMGSDWPAGDGPAFEAGNNFSVAAEADSREQCDTLFGKLAAGGRVKTPLAENFWGTYFGRCTDRFGVDWMIHYTPPKE